MTSNRNKKILITDLDISDGKQQPAVKFKHHFYSTTPKQQDMEKQLHTTSANFNRRSRSAENCIGERKEYIKQSVRINSYFNELLQSKDKKMEKLLLRLTTLHKFNEQFNNQNKELRLHIHALEAQLKEFQDGIASCSRCQGLIREFEKCLNEKQLYASYVVMMKSLVYRLNVQIESYQDRLRRSKGVNCVNGIAKISTQAVDFSHQISNIPTWENDALPTHTLSPLLQSYDEMIRDKDQIIKQYKDEFEHFTGELKRTIEENNRLLQQTETLRRKVYSWREERYRLQTQVDVGRVKYEAQTKKSDLAKEKLVEVLYCYEGKMQTLVLDMQHLQSAYTRCKNELASLRSASLQPPNTMSHDLEECKVLLQQLKKQHCVEKHMLENSIGEFCVCEGENNKNIAKLKKKNEVLEKKLVKERCVTKDLRSRAAKLQRTAENIKHSRDRLKARLRIALQWAQKMEEGQANIQSTWDALKRLESIVKHKESQVRGLHARHLQEMDRMQKKLIQKEDTIRAILRGKLGVGEHQNLKNS